MADPIDLVFRRPRKASIDTLVLDATLSEVHSVDVEVTDHPVETGANVVDHARRKPDVVQLEGVISNTPLGLQPKPLLRFDPDTPQGQSFFDVLDGPDANPTRAETAYQQLQGLADGTPVTIRTTLREYTNMVLESLSVPRSAQTGDSVQFTARFRQVRFVSSQTVATATGPLAPRKSLGTKAPAAATPAQEKTVLLWLYDEASSGIQKWVGK
jgi:hypothetical protein